LFARSADAYPGASIEHPSQGEAMDRAEAFLRAADAKIKLGDFVGVVEDSERSWQAYPNARAQTLKAVALARLAGENGLSAQDRRTRYEASRDASRQALGLEAANPAVYEALAWAQFNLGEFQAAARSASDALRLNSGSAMSYAVRAYAQEALGREADKLADIEEAARIDPARFGEQARTARKGERFFSSGEEEGRFAWSFPAQRRIPLFSLLGLFCAGAAWALWKAMRPSVREDEDRRIPLPRVLDAPVDGLLAGKYRLERVIGKGGMGQVWEAFDVTLDRAVAVKKMSVAGEFESKARELCLQEARTLAGLHHPNIVDIYEILDLPAGLHLVFELLSGRTVQELLAKERSLPIEQARGILRAVGEALEFAHGRGVVHRDLKPSNIMITQTGYVKVMDFGIARKLEDGGPPARAARPDIFSVPDRAPLQAHTRTVAGTPAYMAPESMEGIVSPAADVFSLGVCFYEMLVGELPFGLKGAVQSDSYVPASSRAVGLSVGVDALLSRAMAIRREDRFQSVREFLAALEGIHR
jgi:tetratricopeptide (TPR) repeat protein